MNGPERELDRERIRRGAPVQRAGRVIGPDEIAERLTRRRQSRAQSAARARARAKGLEVPCLKPGPRPRTLEIVLAGRYMGEDTPWEILGVYATRERAVLRCVTPEDFAMVVPFGIDAPEETTYLPARDAWYPLAPST